MADMIPVSEVKLTDIEEKYVVDCIRSGWVSSEGPYVKRFEAACAASVGMAQAIACANGTAALAVAVGALSLPKGSEIIVPSFTIISCVTAIIEAGCVPVLVDCNPETWTMDVNQVEAKITAKTRAIMAVHIYGHPVDMDPINLLAKKHNLFIIEDMAEAHGAEYKGKPCGGLSDISAVSFYANKLVTTGEGGMVFANNPDIAKRARYLINLCFLPDRRFRHTEIGHNYRMSSIQAAVGLAQVERLAQTVARKREMAALYNQKLQGLPVQLPAEKPWAKNNYWMYSMVLDDSVPFDAAECIRRLAEHNIQTRPFFFGMHEQPVFHEMGLFVNEQYPVTERIARRGFYLPSGQAITNDQIDRVCEAMHDVLGNV